MLGPCMELSSEVAMMEAESWFISRGVFSELDDLELLVLLPVNFLCTPRPVYKQQI